MQRCACFEINEASKLESRAQIQGKDFDLVAWYQEGEARLHEKYGIPIEHGE